MSNGGFLNEQEIYDALDEADQEAEYRSSDGSVISCVGVEPVMFAQRAHTLKEVADELARWDSETPSIALGRFKLWLHRKGIMPGETDAAFSTSPERPGQASVTRTDGPEKAVPCPGLSPAGTCDATDEKCVPYSRSGCYAGVEVLPIKVMVEMIRGRHTCYYCEHTGDDVNRIALIEDVHPALPNTTIHYCCDDGDACDARITAAP